MNEGGKAPSASTARRALAAVAALAVAAVLARPGLAVQHQPELRLARLPPPAAAAEPTEPRGATLATADLVRYRELFALQRAGRWDAADRLAARLDDPLLLGHVLAERYLAPTFRPGFAELARWLERYPDHPQAERVNRLARDLRPAGAPAPSGPAAVRLLPQDAAGAGAAVVAAAAPAAATATAGPFGNPGARWKWGLAAWRAGKPRDAAAAFAQLAASDALPAEERAGAAVWAARASLRARRPLPVAGYLRLAARTGGGFYGLLARKMLDGADEGAVGVAWTGGGAAGWPEPGGPPRDATPARAWRYPAVRRAVALAQVGQRALADAELGRVAAAGPGPELGQELAALALALRLPSARARLARGAVPTPRDGAGLPVSGWRPAGGYQLDPDFVHAVVRAESDFDPYARSPAGALGLMQVMPETARLVAKDLNLPYGGDRWLLQPPTNLRIGQAWLVRLAAGPTVNNSLIHLIAAYNAGEGRVADWAAGELRLAGDDPLLYIESVPIAETRAYVKRVLANLWANQARQRRAVPSLRALAQNRWPSLEGLGAAVAAVKERRQDARAD